MTQRLAFLVELVTENVTPEDRQRVELALHNTLHQLLNAQVRYMDPDGEVRVRPIIEVQTVKLDDQ